MPPSTTGSIFNATSSPDRRCGPSERKRGWNGRRPSPLRDPNGSSLALRPSIGYRDKALSRRFGHAACRCSGERWLARSGARGCPAGLELLGGSPECDLGAGSDPNGNRVVARAVADSLGPAEAQPVMPASPRRRRAGGRPRCWQRLSGADFSYCTARARSREYSSLEIVFEFFRRSSFSSSSATLKPTTWRSSSRAC